MATRWEGERDDAAVDAAADDNDGATTVTEVPVVGESTS